MKKQEQQEKQPQRYTKAELMGARRFINNKDLLTVLLKEELMYSTEEAEELIKSYKERMI